MKKIAVAFIFSVAAFLTGEYLYSRSVGKIGFPSFAGLTLIWLAVTAALVCVSAVIYKKSEAKR